jgi:hypothetical protein
MTVPSDDGILAQTYVFEMKDCRLSPQILSKVAAFFVYTDSELGLVNEFISFGDCNEKGTPG